MGQEASSASSVSRNARWSSSPAAGASACNAADAICQRRSTWMKATRFAGSASSHARKLCQSPSGWSVASRSQSHWVATAWMSVFGISAEAFSPSCARDATANCLYGVGSSSIDRSCRMAVKPTRGRHRCIDHRAHSSALWLWRASFYVFGIEAKGQVHLRPDCTGAGPERRPRPAGRSRPA